MSDANTYSRFNGTHKYDGVFCAVCGTKKAKTMLCFTDVRMKSSD